MWLTGILGMATKYTEVFAAMKYRVKDWRGEMMGGAMHVWEQRYKRPRRNSALVGKASGYLVCLLACITIFGYWLCCSNQRYHQCRTCKFRMGSCDRFCVRLRHGIISYFGRLAEGLWHMRKTSSHHGRSLHSGMHLHPVFAIAPFLLSPFASFSNALLHPKAAFGGAVGSGIMFALQFGCARGLISPNEAGLGTAPLISSAAASKNPARQALLQSRLAPSGAQWLSVW